MAGFWRGLYYYLNWEYHSENDAWDNHQKHLKYLCCKELEYIRHTIDNKKIDKEYDYIVKKK